MYLKLKALCSLTKCFIVIGLIRFLLSSWRWYHRLEAVVSNQSSRTQTLSRWDQLSVIWFQNTLPEEHPGRGWPPHCEPGAGGLSSACPPVAPPPPLLIAQSFYKVFLDVSFEENLFCLSQDCCPILNTSSLYQQGFVVQFIREIPESNGHAGAFSFLVFSIITLTANMSLSSD